MCKSNWIWHVLDNYKVKIVNSRHIIGLYTFKRARKWSALIQPIRNAPCLSIICWCWIVCMKVEEMTTCDYNGTKHSHVISFKQDLCEDHPVVLYLHSVSSWMPQDWISRTCLGCYVQDLLPAWAVKSWPSESHHVLHTQTSHTQTSRACVSLLLRASLADWPHRVCHKMPQYSMKTWRGGCLEQWIWCQN